jgi:mono/diheme cytochrome c family protein
MTIEREGAALIAALGVVLAPTSARAGDAALDKAAAEKGRITYVRYCVSCHGPNAKGDGPLANDLRVPVPDLTGIAGRSGGAYPFDRVARIIGSGEIVRGHGTADMPAWGDAFKRTEGTGEKTIEAAIRNLNHYLWSLQKPQK